MRHGPQTLTSRFVLPVSGTLMLQFGPGTAILCRTGSKRFRTIVSRKRSDISPQPNVSNRRMHAFETSAESCSCVWDETAKPRMSIERQFA